jgi:hypothetical protein
MIEIYAPDGEVGKAPAALAAGLPVLRGRKVGILDNTKPNAGLLLGRLGDRLAERTGCEVVTVETKNAALAAPDELMGRLTKEVELVLTGSAD